MNTIRELKQQEKYKNMLKRKNKEKNIYKTRNETLKIKYEGIKKVLEKKEEEIERLNNIINKLEKRLIFDSEESNQDYVEEYLEGCVDEASIILDYLQELKGSDKK